MEPQAVSSGYFVQGFPALRAQPSDYAFNREHTTQRAPTQTLSEYQFHGLNSWRTATQNPAYHYVQASEVPRPTENEQVTKGNIISLKALKERLNNLEDGFYQPTLVNGVLYMVPSSELLRTARESHSDVKTAIEAEGTCETAREVESDVHTARLAQSPNVKSSATDVRITLHQLRRLLGRELFREIIRKYKKEHKAGRMSASGTNIHEEAEPVEHTASDEPFGLQASTSYHDRPESNVNTAVEPRGSEYGIHTARSGYDQPESNVHTACEPASSEMGTAHGIDSEVGAAHRELHTARSPADTSSKDVETAREITDSVRALACSSSHGSVGLRNELDSMVATAEKHLDFGFLPVDAQRSVTEVNLGPRNTCVTTPQDFDNRAQVCAENLGAAPNPNHLASVEGEVNTAVEKASETRLGECSNASSTMAI